MGRYYSGDINGKFMFAVQSSDAGERFGATEQESYFIEYSVNREQYDKIEKELEGNGFNAEVINLRSIKPLDIETIINSVKKTNRVAVIEEGWQQSGVGAEIIAVIIKNAFDFLDAPPLRFSGEDVPLPYAENLEKLALPSTDKILKECLEILQ